MENIKYDPSSPWISREMKSWSNLISNSKHISIKKENIIYSQGSIPTSVFIVDSGRIRICTYHPSGKERHLYIAEHGCLFGENSVILNHPHNSSAVAITTSILYQIPMEFFLERLHSDHVLASTVLQLLCQKYYVLSHAIVASSFSHALNKVAYILVCLAEQYTIPVKGGISINIRFSQQDIANIIGVSRVTVNNIFNMLMKEGILGRRNGKVEIYDMERLKLYIYADK